MYYDVLLSGQLVWNLPLFALLIGIAVLYCYVMKHFTTLRLVNKQAILFFLALCILYLIIGSPLAAFSHLTLSLHMIQMSVIFFIIPPLILSGLPSESLEKLTPIPSIVRMRKVFLQPTLALILFSLLFFLYHLPVTLDLLSQAPFIQNSFLFLLFILSFSMWWPIVSPNPKQRFSKKKKKQFMLLSGLLLMPACSILIWSAFFNGVQNPHLNQIAVLLCIPPGSNSLGFLNSSFHTTYDPLLAGILMLGIHKSALALSSRLVKNSH